ncbi:MAG: hypothetical protein ACREDG_06790, partial [Methylocella sp.]
VFAAILSAGFLGCYGFFTASTPVALMMSMLFAGGFVWSLEFTILNAIAYAEIDSAKLNAADGFASVAQQWAFVAMAAVSLSAVAAFLRLPVDAGSELTRRRFWKAAQAISLAGQ